MTSPPGNSGLVSITQTVTGATGALLEDDHAGALTLLQSALTHAKAGLSCGGNQTASFLQEIRREVPFQLYALPLETGKPCDVHRSASPGSLFSFYNAAIVSDEICSEMELLFSAELSAMILYNLGLVYHRSALMTGSTTYFSKAIKLYDVAASIVLAPDSEFNFVHDMTVLRLALHVNMGHIYSNFFDQEGTTRCAEGIQTLYNSANIATMNPEVRKLFLENMFVTQTQYHFSLAPAA